MSCEWKACNLGSIMTFKNGKKRPKTVGKFPVYGGNGILGYTNEWNNENCVVIGRVGAYCGSVFREYSKCWISDNAICGISNNDNIEYLYYLLSSLQLNHRHIGTSQPLLTQEILNNIQVTIPPYVVQNKIALILRSLDDKIELNDKINDNLQQQVSEIYRAWYQDFMCAGDVPLVESEYGMIPEGWHYSLLGKLCKSISVTHKFDAEKLIFLNTGDVEDGRFLHSNYMAISDMPGQAKKTIAPGDILYSEIRPINKHFAYVNFPAANYVVSTKLMVIRANSFDSRRLYHFLTSRDVLSELQMQAESRSGTFPQIRFDNVSKLPILIADDATEATFTTLLHTVYEQIEHNNRENEKLSTLRDSLLPRLMSGEIDVSAIQI